MSITKEDAEAEASRVHGWLCSVHAGAKTTMTTKGLRTFLLRSDGWIIKSGYIRPIKSKRIGPGVYEVWLGDIK